MKLFGIIGAGGFGKEVIPLVELQLKIMLANSNYEIVFIDKNVNLKAINNYAVLSMDEFFLHPATDKYFNIAITDYQMRKNIAELMIVKGARPFTITALNSVNLSHNEIGEGAIFCPFTTITANAKIGKFFHANIYSYVAHDCLIGDYVTFGPNVHCNGNVIIQDYAYIGTGVIIKQGLPEKSIVIGEGAVLGMGAVVTKSIPAYTTVVGNPARPLEKKNIHTLMEA